jgi:hypothetical protein
VHVHTRHTQSQVLQIEHIAYVSDYSVWGFPHFRMIYKAISHFAHKSKSAKAMFRQLLRKLQFRELSITHPTR